MVEVSGSSESFESIEFSGIWVPLVTPFRNGELDLPALRRLVKHLLAQGVSGLVACGSTGEAAMLDEAEQSAVLAATLDAAAGAPVLMGLSGVRPERVAERAVRLADEHASLAGYLVSAPAYVKPSQAGLLGFFVRVADASPLPLVVYDIPSRTGVRIECATLLQLSAHPRIQALKDCSGDADAARALIGDGRLALLGGNDDEMFDQLARGAAGAFAASAHLCSADFVRLHRLIGTGQLADARALWGSALQGLAAVTEALFAEPNPAVIKGLLARQGWMTDEVRVPMCVAARASVDRAEAVCLQVSRQLSWQVSQPIRAR